MAVDMGKPGATRKVLKLFSDEVEKIEGRNLKGMLSAANIIMRKSQETTPYETGHLESSHYVSHNANLKNPIAEVGLTATYAPAVHERVGAKIKKSGRRPLFLLLAIIENKALILQTIRRAIQVKK